VLGTHRRIVRDGIAEPGAFWVVEMASMAEPFPAPSGLEHATTTAT
jgi:hypothetical protein